MKDVNVYVEMSDRFILSFEMSPTTAQHALPSSVKFLKVSDIGIIWQ